MKVGVALVAFVAACGPPPPSPEQQVLTNFFRASRVRDTTVLGGIAAVVFEPRRDGVVQEFEVTESGLEQPGTEGRVSKSVTIRAAVRTPDGQTAARDFVVTMERGAGPSPERWFITGFTPLRASQTSPAASSARPN